MINSWEEVHHFYQQNTNIYPEQKFQHAISSLFESLHINATDLTDELLNNLLQQTLQTKEWMVKNILSSRAKDFQTSFRKMIYDTDEEMQEVVGSLDDNVFIKEQSIELEILRQRIFNLQEKLSGKKIPSV
jgi:hypothetical protein